ncbi:MAG: substrate-binding domain-containing protein [Streptosporangiales bacterium]|nr:substrate-binding domain-containing protein [Streptosporangiales bacterium]
MNKVVRRLVLTGTALALTLGASACGGGEQGAAGGGDEGQAGKIGILLPESKTARYEAFDRPLMEKKLKQLCPQCEILYQNADQDAAKQQQQAESMLTQGVKVLILDAVDAKAAGGIVTSAKQQGVAVVAYDRLATGPVDYYVSFDNHKVGQVQGQTLLEALGDDRASGQIVMINGAPTDPNAAEFKAGAESVLKGEVEIGRSYDTPDWSPDKAQQEMEQAITALGKDNIIGVYAANDGTASGAIAAMKAAGFANNVPVTGQDAELAAIQRIVADEQYMTVYKAIKPEADAAAEMAVALLQGKKYDKATATKNNGSKDVPSVLLEPVAVTKDNIKETVVADGFWSVDEICTARYADACAKAGLR